jgi:DNA-binding GntR family transcriptional regulator
MLSLEISPGQRVAVDLLARRYHVSQTPVREALSRLESEGLVVKHHLRGYRATDLLTPLEFRQMFEVRLLLEPFAAARAAATIDPERLADLAACERAMTTNVEEADAGDCASLDATFHDIIAGACDNPLVRQQLTRLFCHLHLFRQRRDKLVVEEALDEHGLIVIALQRRDPVLAEAAMRSHIERSRDRVLASFD